VPIQPMNDPDNPDNQEFDYFPIPSDEQLLENIRNKEKNIKADLDRARDLVRYHEIEKELDTIYVGLVYDEPAWLTRLKCLLAERRDIRKRIKK
jgi:hypothetical protein